MNEAELKAAPGEILHFPTVLGAVVPVYNLPGVTDEVKFTGPIIRRHRARQDSQVERSGPREAQSRYRPSRHGHHVDRTASDGSGTTFIFADYLAKVSPEFKSTVGVDSALKWPTGVGGKGNEGVSGLVRQTPGALGYVELVYALQTKMPHGAVQNSDGVFVRASIESVTAAAETMEIPTDFRVSITNPPGAERISDRIVYVAPVLRGSSLTRRKAESWSISSRWAITEGQKFAGELGYAPLPRNVAEMELKALEQIRVQ